MTTAPKISPTVSISKTPSPSPSLSSSPKTSPIATKSPSTPPTIPKTVPTTVPTTVTSACPTGQDLVNFCKSCSQTTLTTQSFWENIVDFFKRLFGITGKIIVVDDPQCENCCPTPAPIPPLPPGTIIPKTPFECKADGDCGSQSGRPYCYGGICVECNGKDDLNQCAAKYKDKQMCSNFGECVICASNENCGWGDTPVCDTNGCRACKTDEDCGSRDGKDMHCITNTGRCVECRGNTDCHYKVMPCDFDACINYKCYLLQQPRNYWCDYTDAWGRDIKGYCNGTSSDCFECMDSTQCPNGLYCSSKHTCVTVPPV